MSVQAGVATPRGLMIAAIHLAQADADERCKLLMDAREDALFHADALSILPAENAGRCHGLGHAYSTLIAELLACIEDERCAVASDHNLWDGVENDEIPLDSAALMIRRHRDEARRHAA